MMLPSEESTNPSAAAMRAAVLVAPGRVEIKQTPRPVPQPGEVLVRLEGCGVCASNVPPWEGRSWFQYPMEPGALGHEAWGTVERLGNGVETHWLGQRVAMLSYHGYAEYDVAAASSLVPLGPGTPGEPFPGEPLGCAMNIYKRAQIQPGTNVAVIGIGFLGALLVELAAGAGAKVIALVRKPESAKLAQECGASSVVMLDDHHRIIEEVSRLTVSRFCDVVIEATGKQWPLDLAGELTRERGRLVVAGYHQDGPRQVNMQLWNWRGLDVINAHERDPVVYHSGMAAAVEAVAGGRIHPRRLYTHVLPLERLAEGLTLTQNRPLGFVKALVQL